MLSGEPEWVLEEVVHRLHDEQVVAHGGGEGVRDQGVLESALNRPKQAYYYHEPPIDLYDLAAAYAFGIAKNHPFVDGNKRTAYVTARTFLALNGLALTATKEDKYLTMIKLAEGMIGEEGFAAWLRTHGVEL